MDDREIQRKKPIIPIGFSDLRAMTKKRLRIRNGAGVAVLFPCAMFFVADLRWFRPYGCAEDPAKILRLV